jgi:hypothetical protein
VTTAIDSPVDEDEDGETTGSIEPPVKAAPAELKRFGNEIPDEVPPKISDNESRFVDCELI